MLQDVFAYSSLNEKKRLQVLHQYLHVHKQARNRIAFSGSN